MGKKRKLSPLQIKEMQQIFPEVNLPVAKVGDVIRFCIDLDEQQQDSNINILYAKVRAIVVHGESKDLFLDLDGVWLHSPTFNVTCTNQCWYSYESKQLLGVFVNTSGDSFFGRYDVIEISAL